MNSILEVIIPSAIVLAAGLIIILGLAEKKEHKN